MIDKINLFQTNGTLLLSRNDIISSHVTDDTTTTTKLDFPTVLDSTYHASTDTDNNDLEEIFQKAGETYNISTDLLKAVAKAESDFDPNCVSSSGAMGIMQLMPDTANELGVTDAFDPEQNIMAGAKYLAENLKIYNGDVSLALAAYNAGRGNVAKYGGIPPFTETRNYVKKILSYMGETVDVPNITVNSSTEKNATLKTASISSDTKTTSKKEETTTETDLNLTPADLDNDLLTDIFSSENNTSLLQETSQQLLTQSTSAYLLFNQLTNKN